MDASPERTMPKVGRNINPVLNDARAACASELLAVEFWERNRWADTPACVHCGDTDVYAMRSRSGEREARFRWRCRGCKKYYTVRVGTVMEDSNMYVTGRSRSGSTPARKRALRRSSCNA